MDSVLQIAPSDAIRRIQRVQTVTIAWMSVEALVSLFAAWKARSVSLLAFCRDSAVELLSAMVVLWKFRTDAAHERRAVRIAGVLLFLLATYLVAASVMTLSGYSEPKPTLLGIAILVAAAANHAMAREREANAVGGYGQFCPKRRCDTVRSVRLPFGDRLVRISRERKLACKVG